MMPAVRLRFLSCFKVAEEFKAEEFKVAEDIDSLLRSIVVLTVREEQPFMSTVSIIDGMYGSVIVVKRC